MARQYTPARAFRAALEQRLNTLAHNEGLDLTRLRRRVAFERLLARFFAGHPAAPVWVLKGSYGLEVRLRDHARSTLDIDLGIPAPAQIAPPSPDQADLIWEPYSRRLRSIWMTGLPSRLGPPCTIWRHLPTEESVTQWRTLLIIVFLRGSIWMWLWAMQWWELPIGWQGMICWALPGFPRRRWQPYPRNSSLPRRCMRIPCRGLAREHG